MPNPVEIINGPLSLYWAPVGESFPDVDAAPGGNWTLIGTSGADNYTEDGVEISHEKAYNVFRGLNSAYPIKAFRTEADIMVSVTLADLTLAQARLAFNNNTVGSDAGPPSISTLDLDVSGDVAQMALLARGTGKSPEFDGGDAQLELNIVSEIGAQALTFVKGDPVGLTLEFQAFFDTVNSELGRLVVQNA